MNYEEIIKLMRDGEIDVLKAYVQLKTQYEEIGAVLEEFKDAARHEAEKYGQKSFSAFGCQIELRNGPSTWNYDSCAAYKQAQERLKYIQSLAQSGGAVDPSSGEFVAAAVKIEGKATMAVKLKK